MGFVFHVVLVLDIRDPSVCNLLVNEIDASVFAKFELSRNSST